MGGSGPIGATGPGGDGPGGYSAGGSYGTGGAYILGGYGGAGGYYGGAGGYYGGAGGYVSGGAGAGGTPSDCGTCVALTCGSQLLQCAQSPGCAKIFGCVQATGCTGIDCYSSNTCRQIIDDTGGLGSYSMTQLLSALTCVLQSGCGCRL